MEIWRDFLICVLCGWILSMLICAQFMGGFKVRVNDTVYTIQLIGKDAH